MSYQDWNPVFLSKPKPRPIYKHRVSKIEEPTLINFDTSRWIARKRQEMGLTQKDLALRIDEKVDVVQNYESGTALYDSRIIRKIRQVLKD